LVGTIQDANDRITLITNIRGVVNQLLKLSKDKMAASSYRNAPLFQTGDLVYFSTKYVYTSGHKNANTFETNK